MTVNLSTVPTGRGFWYPPIKVGENVTINCLYIKGEKTSNTVVNNGLSPVVTTYQIFLYRVQILLGQLLITDRTFDPVPRKMVELYSKDCSVIRVD